MALAFVLTTPLATLCIEHILSCPVWRVLFAHRQQLHRWDGWFRRLRLCCTPWAEPACCRWQGLALGGASPLKILGLLEVFHCPVVYGWICVLGWPPLLGRALRRLVCRRLLQLVLKSTVSLMRRSQKHRGGFSQRFFRHVSAVSLWFVPASVAWDGWLTRSTPATRFPDASSGLPDPLEGLLVTRVVAG